MYPQDDNSDVFPRDANLGVGGGVFRGCSGGVLMEQTWDQDVWTPESAAEMHGHLKMDIFGRPFNAWKLAIRQDVTLDCCFDLIAYV